MSVTGTVDAVDAVSWGDDDTPAWQVIVTLDKDGSWLAFACHRAEVIRVGERVTVPVQVVDRDVVFGDGRHVRMLGGSFDPLKKMQG